MPPGITDESVRAAAKAEIDAIVAREIFGLTRDELVRIIGTFPVLKRREERQYGEFRSMRLVMNAYDAVAEAFREGVPYTSVLDSEPGQGRRHPESSLPDWAMQGSVE